MPDQVRCFFVETTGQTREIKEWCAQCKTDHSYIESEYRRTDTGEIRWSQYWPDAEFGPGAMFFRALTMQHEGIWYKGNGNWNNDDGHHLFVTLPNHRLWDIDNRCSNCAMPEDRMHRCWVRHGEVPNITVDKNGFTCLAGGGSIWSNQGQSDEWHGFLQNGYLIRV